MADSYKDIIITPFRSNTADPKIEFRGGNSAANVAITVTMYPDSNGTLSFDASAGQLFSITNDLSGLLWSVNDVSGIPSAEVYANGTVSFAPFSGNVGIGFSSGTISDKLSVNGNVNANSFILNTGVNIGTQAANAYAAANSAANTARVSANGASTIVAANGLNFINTATVTVSVTSGTNGNANIAFTSAGDPAAYAQANAAYGQANAAYGQANAAYGTANTANATANLAYAQANVARTTANDAYGQANTARTTANDAYGQANTARTTANNAYDAANNRVLKSGDTMTGQLTVNANTRMTGNIIDIPTVAVTTSGTYADNVAGKTLVVSSASDVTITFAPASLSDFAVSVIRAGAGNVTIANSATITRSNIASYRSGNIASRNSIATVVYTATNAMYLFGDIETVQVDTGVGAAYDQANAAFSAANSAANTVRVSANSGSTITKANGLNFINTSSVTVSVVSGIDGNANISFFSSGSSPADAYAQANAAYDQANSARGQANTAYGQANTAYGQANTAYGQANLAYGAANSAANTVRVSLNNVVSQNAVSLNFNNTSTVSVTVGAGVGGNANISFTTAVDANLAYNQANSAYNVANLAYGQANAAYGTANTANATANLAYAQANTARTTANDAYGQANTARTTANDAYGQANTARTTANDAYGQANTARTTANNAYDAANNRVLKSGDTMTGQLTINANTRMTGNIIDIPTVAVTTSGTYADNVAGKTLVVSSASDVTLTFAPASLSDFAVSVIRAGSGNVTIANSATITRSNIASYKSGNIASRNSIATVVYTATNAMYLFGDIETTVVDTGVGAAYDQANSAFAAANSAANTVRVSANSGSTLTKANGLNFINTATVTVSVVSGIDGNANISFTSAAGGDPAAAYAQANAAYNQANAAYGGANTANTNALNAYGQANTARTTANDAYAQANTARTTANDSYAQANTARTTANDAYAQANTARNTANSAYGQANNAYGAANSAANTARVSANGGSTIVAANGLNFINTASVTVSVTAGTNGNANISFTASGSSPADAYAAANAAANTVRVSANSGSTITKANGLNFINTATVTVSVTAGTDGNANVSFTSTGGSGSPGGANQQLQFNNTGAFGGSANLFFDLSDNTFVSAAKTELTGNIWDTPILTVTASGTYGDNAAGKVLFCNTTADVVLTFAPATLPGFAVSVIRGNSGNVTIANTSTLTRANVGYSTLNIASQNSSATVVYTATNRMTLFGDLQTNDIFTPNAVFAGDDVWIGYNSTRPALYMYTAAANIAPLSTNTLGLYAKNVANNPMFFVESPRANNSSYDEHFVVGPSMMTKSISWMRPNLFGTTNTTCFITNGLAMNCIALTSYSNVANGVPRATNFKTSFRSFQIGANANATTGNATVFANCNTTWAGSTSAGGGYVYATRFTYDTLATNVRSFIGLSNALVSMVSSATDYNPFSNLVHHLIGVGANAATGNLWFICGANGTARTVSDLGNQFPMNTNDVFELIINVPPGGGSVGYLVRNLSNGAEVQGVQTTNMPPVNVFMQPHYLLKSNTAAVSNLSIMQLYLETDQ